jgi:hypothetical protein
MGPHDAAQASQLTKIHPTISTPLPLHSNSPLPRATSLPCQVTRVWVQGAPLRLKRYRLHSAVPEAVPELMQAGQRRTEVAAGATPKHLGGRGCAWPHDRVEVLWAGLFRPE